MNKLSNLILAGACSLGMAFSAIPAEAASGAPATIAGVPMDQIQTVDHRRGGGRGGHGGWGNHGGGRHHGGWGRDRHRGYYGRGYGGHHRSHTGRYVAAGVLGLAAGAAIAGSNRSHNCRYVRNGRAYYRPC
ncbi:MAG TPA: hypothetical protein VGC51_14220 [Hansschlegelia sp.]